MSVYSINSIECFISRHAAYAAARCSNFVSRNTFELNKAFVCHATLEKEQSSNISQQQLVCVYLSLIERSID